MCRGFIGDAIVCQVSLEILIVVFPFAIVAPKSFDLVVGLLLNQGFEVFEYLKRFVIVFGFKEVHLCVTGLVVNKYHKVFGACN